VLQHLPWILITVTSGWCQKSVTAQTAGTRSFEARQFLHPNGRTQHVWDTLIRHIMTKTLFFSSLPSAPTRIPRPHIWLKNDRKQCTVWYSGSVYPRYVWATHRLCITWNCSAKFNRADTKSRRFMNNFRSLFSCLHFKPVCNRKRKKFNLSMKFLRRSQWSHSLRRGSADTRLLGLRARIPPGCTDLLRMLCVVGKRSLRRADRSSGGVLPRVVCTIFSSWKLAVLKFKRYLRATFLRVNYVSPV
jgi:hypothetical protein